MRTVCLLIGCGYNCNENIKISCSGKVSVLRVGSISHLFLVPGGHKPLYIGPIYESTIYSTIYWSVFINGCQNSL